MPRLPSWHLEDWALPILSGELAGMRWLVPTRSSFFLGRYELDQTPALAAALAANSTFFDIGAHYGYYTLLASRRVARGQVFAFEPSPHNLRFLRRHVELNHCSNVRLLEVAVCDHEGAAHFEDRCGSGVGHLADDGPITVRTVSLDGLCASGVLPAPDVMKIDVEGAELAVLRGADQLLSAGRTMLFLSVHGDALRADCCRFLWERGYILQPVRRRSSLESSSEIVARPPRR
jgi:FkbM family methyltransferase